MIQSDKSDSYMDIRKTANLLLNFTIKRLAEIFGILIFATGIFLLIALITYSPEDPNFIFPENKEIMALYQNILIGQKGINESRDYSAKGLKYFDAKDYLNAALEFEKALDANPLDYAHYENAATANYLNGNLNKALEQINYVINEANPLNGKCEYIKALIFIKLGDPIGACPLLITSKDSGFTQANGVIDQYCR